MFYGSLTIGVRPGNVPPDIPCWYTRDTPPGTTLVNGTHIPDARNNKGEWITRYDNSSVGEAVVPTRNKQIIVDTIGCDASEALSDKIADAVAGLDPAMQGQTYGSKLERMMEGFRTLNFSGTVRTYSNHGTFILLSGRMPVYVAAVADPQSYRIMWYTDREVETQMRDTDVRRYVFYRMPTLEDRALFIPSQVVCSRWWNWQEKMEDSNLKMLRCFNALESFLYRSGR